MGAALREAALAVDHGDVPVGAVALVGGRVVAARHNEREKQGDPTAHAEVLALSDAAAAVGSWRLSEVTLVVTLEPCPMCAGALVAARLGRLVFGATDMKAGSCGSLYNLCADPRLNHEVPVTAGVRAEESADCSPDSSDADAAASVSDGGMREWPNRTVSKTVVSQGTVGSNPTPSAM